MVPGIPPREASDRLGIFQARFDELWRKYETYSGKSDVLSIPVFLWSLQTLTQSTFHVILKKRLPLCMVRIGQQQFFFCLRTSLNQTNTVDQLLFHMRSNGCSKFQQCHSFVSKHKDTFEWRFLRHNADVKPGF